MRVAGAAPLALPAAARRNSQFIQEQRPVRSIPGPGAGATLLLVDSTSTTCKGAYDDEHDDLERLHLPIVLRRHLHLRLPGRAEGQPIGMSLRRGLRLRTRLPLPALGSVPVFPVPAPRPRAARTDRRGRSPRSGCSAGLEVAPDLLKDSGIDDARVCFLRLLLRIQDQRHRPASWPQRCRVEDV